MSMILVKSIVRPEKADAVMEGLFEAGYPAVTKVEVFGRGKQRGIKIGEVRRPRAAVRQRAFPQRPPAAAIRPGRP